MWMLVLFALVCMFIFSSLENSVVEWGEFYSLLNDPDSSQAVKKLIFRGTDVIVVEIDDTKKDKLPEELKQVFRTATASPSIACRSTTIWISSASSTGSNSVISSSTTRAASSSTRMASPAGGGVGVLLRTAAKSAPRT